MQAKTIIRLILGGIMVALVAIIITLSCILGHTCNQLTALRIKNNYLQQTVKQLEQEEKQRIEIMERAQERLDRAEKVKNYQEARDIWQEVYRALSSP